MERDDHEDRPEPRPAGSTTLRPVAVVVPHTHWDREWYAPFETMRFHLLRFFDDLIETMEHEPDLVFLLDGQTVMVEDYLEIRRDQEDRIVALVRSGRLRLGPCYVQPDEFHVSGESLIRNLAIGCEAAARFGAVMRHGYLPDTFGHVHQLPQLLQGFSIETFYAMRGVGPDVGPDDEFWWEAPDGSRVRATWLSESYSSAAVLADDPARMQLRHAALVRYDRLEELLDRLSARTPSGIMLLLNGGDHLLVQHDVPQMVHGLDAGVDVDLRLGGLEEYHALVDQRPPPDIVVTGELRHGLRHDVFDGIGSTRTPLKVTHARVESLVCDVAERLDALATVADGRSNLDSMRHLWRELIKNHAHDSICGCSADAVHTEMDTRFVKISQLARAVIDDSLHRLARAVAGAPAPGEVPIVVVNPSAVPRSGPVTVAVVPDLGAPLGRRVFGWQQGESVDWDAYELVDEHGATIPFTVAASPETSVVDILTRRKEVVTHQVRFAASDIPPLATQTYRLVPHTGRNGEPAPVDGDDDQLPANEAGGLQGEEPTPALRNERIAVAIAADGTLQITDLATSQTFQGLCELLDDGDAGDLYGFGPMADPPLSSRDATWVVDARVDALHATATWTIPSERDAGTGTRSATTTQLDLAMVVTLQPDSDRVDVTVTVDNNARDHRLRLRMPTGAGHGKAVAETAFGVLRRSVDAPDDTWHDPPSGVHAMRRFVVAETAAGGLQVLSEGLHEYQLDDRGHLDLTLLRAVGWLARTDHPRRNHKIGPELATPDAQCLGRHTFRIGLRPTSPREGVGDWYRHAEQFSVPLQAMALQGRPAPLRSPAHNGHAPSARQPSSSDRPVTPGLSITPDAVVLSAIKTAQDGDGVIVRVFNAATDPQIARLQTRLPLTAVWRCDLEERRLTELDAADDGRIDLDLRGGEIATLRLTSERHETKDSS